MSPRNHTETNEETHKEKISKEDFEEILWVTEFSEESAKEFCKNLFEKSERDSIQPIVIYIDSWGGNVDSLISMIAAMDSVPNKIVTVCMGKAASAGAVLLSHGDIRFVSQYGRVMVHEASGGICGNVHDVKIDVKELEIANDTMLALLAQNCSMSLSKLKQKFTGKRRDIFMSAEESILFGIADKIGLPKINKVVKYEID